MSTPNTYLCRNLKIQQNLHTGFFIKANITQIGTTPRTVNKIMPGIKKLWKGELSIMDRGIPIISPVGEIINTIPPKRAPNPKKANKKSSKFRVFIKM